jgi:hypothetical protein
MSFWDRLTVVPFVLNPALTTMCCCDGMKGGTLSLVYMMIKSVYYHTNVMVYSRRQMNEN